MKQLKKYIFFLLLFIQPHIHAQLKEFMVQWYIYDNNIAKAPWRSDSTYFTQMKNFNFNTAFFDVFPNQEYLYFLQKTKNAGLKSIIKTDYLSLENEFNEENAKSELEKYTDSIDYNVIGYEIKDEPSLRSLCSTCLYVIENIPNFTNAIKKHNSSLLRYANLYAYPNLISIDNDYREKYVQKYIDTSKPNLLSFDTYPGYDDITTFYKALYDISLKSVENSIPFIYVLTPYKHHSDFLSADTTNSLPAKTMSEFNYSIYAALAYGAKGISYWPGFEWVITVVGNKHYPLKLNYGAGTGRLDSLASLHQKLINHSDVLLSLNFASAYHVDSSSTTYQGHNEQIHKFCKWSDFETDRYAISIFTDTGNYPIVDVNTNDVPQNLAITFLTNNAGQIYFWLFNKSLTNTMTLHPYLDINPIRDVLNDVDIDLDNANVNITLNPGEAKLFTSTTASSQITKSILNSQYYATGYPCGFYPYESACRINLGVNGSTPSVVFNTGVTKSFGAHYIDIKNTRISSGSTVRLKAYTDCNTTTGVRSAYIESNTSIDSIKAKDKATVLDASVYPNPTVGDFVLHVNLNEKEEIDVRVYNGMGGLVRTLKTDAQDTKISLQGNASGMYLVRFQRADKFYSFKVVKR